MNDPPGDPILGIDLGTTNSLVAWCDASGTPRVIPDESGEPLVPSVVRYGGGGRVESVGREARAHAVEHAPWTISSVKRLMGRSRRDAEPDLAHLSYEVVEGPNATARVKLPDGTVISPQEVSAVILRRLKEQASRALGFEARRAVITVPAYFDDAQRQATRDAGRLAGLEVVRIVNEPTAAALAYGLGLTARREETIAVYDLGGGTFDISILKVIPKVPASVSDGPAPGSPGPKPQAPSPDLGADFFQVLATKGDTHLGGDDVDQMLASLVQREAEASLGRALEFTPRTRQELRHLAERTKIALSGADHASIRIDLGDPGAAGAGVFERTIDRAEFERLIEPWVHRTIELCRRALRDARLTPRQIDRVVMVGGSTRIPLVRRLVGEFFGREPYTALDPDEVVALGAAVQASIMAGATMDMLLLDVIPLSLGIETVGGAFAKIIVKNTTIPARAAEMFSTSVDGQTSIRLTVLQGEREMAADCRMLGVFHLRGIPPMPAGIPQVEVEFLVDASGILSVSAHERRSGRRATLQVVPNHGLSAEEIERIEAASLAHAREDMTRHRIVDLIAGAKLDLKWIGERFAALGAGLPREYREELEGKAAALRELVSRAESDWRSVDANAFHAAKEALDRASVRLHEISIAESLRRG